MSVFELKQILKREPKTLGDNPSIEVCLQNHACTLLVYKSLTTEYVGVLPVVCVLEDVTRLLSYTLEKEYEVCGWFSERGYTCMIDYTEGK